MGYCDLNDILAVMDEQDVIRFTDDGDTGAVDTDVVAAAIASATAQVDSFISGRYGANLDAPVPGLVTMLAVEISIYRLACRRGDAPEELRVRYEDALKHLDRVADGKADIPGITVDEDAVTDDPSAAVVAPDQRYSGLGTGLAGY